MGLRLRHDRPASDARRSGCGQGGPARSQASAPRASCEARDLPVDAGWSLASRSVRPQAAARAVRRQGHSLFAAVEPHHAGGRLLQADGSDLWIPASRRFRTADLGLAAAHEPVHGRSLRVEGDGVRQRGACTSRSTTPYGSDPARAAVDRFLGGVRSGHGKPQPPRFRHDRAERERRRRQRAVVRERLLTGNLSRHRSG